MAEDAAEIKGAKAPFTILYPAMINLTSHSRLTK
jgi:hypothetical protein